MRKQVLILFSFLVLCFAQGCSAEVPDQEFNQPFVRQTLEGEEIIEEDEVSKASSIRIVVGQLELVF
ncbi:MAG: hypothetical protein AAF206_06275 [Bacteroidota bacterium]